MQVQETMKTIKLLQRENTLSLVFIPLFKSIIPSKKVCFVNGTL